MTLKKWEECEKLRFVCYEYDKTVIPILHGGEMFIISKDKKAIVNADSATVIYVGSDGITIKADFKNGRGCQLGRYDSLEECKKTLEMMAKEVGKVNIFQMPESAAIKAEIVKNEACWHHATGKKTKGHGGS